MNNRQLVMYRQVLLALRAHVRREMDLLLDVAHELAIDRTQLPRPKACRTCRPTWRTMLAGLVGATVNQFVLRKEELLDQIDAALARIDDGGFGACWECGEMIPESQLATLPYAERCADCESQRVWRRRIA